MKSVLTARQQRLAPAARVAALVRIIRRAEAKADWLDELLAVSEVVNAATMMNDRNRSKRRAERAADELVRTVNDNPTAGWTREQRAYAAAWETER